MPITALDTHCHADMMQRHDAVFGACYKELGLGGITWSYVPGPLLVEDYPDYWDGLETLCGELTEAGVPFHYLVGIHPRSIPEELPAMDQLPAAFTEALARHAGNPRCLGLGELGLDLADGAEEKVLRWQLEWAVAHLPPAKRIGIHTPRAAKLEVTRTTLELLRDYPSLHQRMVIDHVNPETLPLVRMAGFAMGVTLQEGKTSVAELVAAIRDDPELCFQIMLNSDGATRLSAPFLEFLARTDLVDPDCHRALVGENGRRFFNI